MSKIFTETHTERYMCECMGKPCDYYDKCEYPTIYYDSRFENGIEVKKFIKGKNDSGGVVTFKHFCMRDDILLQRTWDEKRLNGFIEMVKKEFHKLECNFDDLKSELQELGLWEENHG